jgi:hypothetical protein
MIKVRFTDSWGLDLNAVLAQHTPEGKQQWGNVLFTADPIPDADYIIILNSPPQDMKVNVSPDRLWCGIGEPGISHYRYLHNNRKEYSRVYGCDEQAAQNFKNYILSIPILDRWKVNRSYDFLNNSDNIPEKINNLSWITSNKGKHRRRKGLKYRLDFLERIMKSNVDFDLYGKGFQFVEDKWDAIAPYRYTIAFENHISNHYWSEKLTDILVCETMPIYIGSKKITQYFPEDCMVIINPDDKYVFERINDIIHSDLREQNLAAIKTAKDLVLNKYNMLKFFSDEIEKHAASIIPAKKTEIKIKHVSLRYPYWIYDEAVWRWPYCLFQNIRMMMRKKI